MNTALYSRQIFQQVIFISTRGGQHSAEFLNASGSHYVLICALVEKQKHKYKLSPNTIADFLIMYCFIGEGD